MLRVLLGSILPLALLGAPAQAIGAREALARLGCPRDSEKRVLGGQLVETPLETVSARDLNVGVALLVTEAPEAFTRELFDELLLERVGPEYRAHGRFEGEGSAAQLATLELTEAQRESYAGAEAGEDLNLSREELAELDAAGGDAAAIQARVREQLLARYRAYRAHGLPGIAPYDRGGSRTDPGAELARNNRVIREKRILPTEFYDLLDASLGQGSPSDLTEVFGWSQFEAHGEDTITLTHAFGGTFGGVPVAVQRIFYASTGYNAEQSIAGFLPVNEGTLVIYTNHTSTDQVAGFGGRAKRALGRRFVAAQLQRLFRQLLASAY